LVNLFTVSFAGTIDQNVADEKYIEYGKKHECVVQLKGTFGDKKQVYHASAVIIKPKIILTAAHVINSSNDCYIIVNDEKINIMFGIMSNNYVESKIGPHDIAICYLENKANLKFYPVLYSNNDEIGKICSISGFGTTGTYQVGASKVDNKKRAGSNIVDGLISGMLVCSVNKPPKTSLEFLICHGDSGGGLFIDQKLAGINSCIMTDDGKLDSNFNEDSLHTRISFHKEWIDSMVEKLEKLD
jgi:hypothetical protein